MALVLADRVRDTTTTTGTGTVTLSGTAPTGYQNFSVVGNGNTTYYTINAGSQWEVGIGTYSSTGPTLSRDTILASSSSGSAVDFASGTKDVFVTYPAEKSVNYDASDNVGIGTTSPASKLDIATGNLRFSGTGQRILGDFSNATFTNRLAFQTTTANSNTGVSIIPSASGFNAALNLETDPTFASGSVLQLVAVASSDARINSGNRGTGTYLPMTFYTNGSERMRLDTSGNLGIGTSSPTQKLEVNGQTVTGNITVKGDGSEGGQITLNNAANSAATYAFDVDGSGHGRIFTVTNNTNLTLGQLSGTGGIFAVYTGGSERMRIDSSGNVGIGTSAPTSLLHVKRGSNATERYPSGTWASQIINATDAGAENGLVVGNRWAASSSTVFEAGSIYGNGSLYWSSYYKIDGVGQHFWGYGASGLEGMRLNTSGNVGIGTSAPGAKLDVNGTSTTDIFHVTNGTTYFTAGVTNGTQVELNAYQTAVGAKLLSIQSAGGATNFGGNVGIGTASPSFKLEALGGIAATTGSNQVVLTTDGSIEITRSSGDAYIDLKNTTGEDWDCRIQSAGTTTPALTFSVNGSERMRITDAGNVGVGTTAPQSKMEIRATSGGSTFNALTLSNYVGASVNTGVALYFDPNGAGSLARAASIQSVQSTSGNYADLRFFTANSDTPAERIRITPAGNVGIGTSNPVNKFEVVGPSGGDCIMINRASNAAYFQLLGASFPTYNAIQSLDGSGNEYWGIGGYGNANTIVFRTNSGAERMRITSAGNVAIGNSNAAPKFSVTLGTGFAWGGGWNTAAAVFGGNGAGSGSGSGGLAITYDDTDGGTIGPVIPGVAWKPLRLFSDTLQFYTNGATERMRITNAGRVGIGISTPSGPLDVRGATGTTAIINSYNTTTTGNVAGYFSDLQSTANSTSSYHYAGVTQGVNIWYLYGNGSSSWSSDQRLKKNIEATRDGYLDDLCKLRVVKYNWRTDDEDKPRELGLIAQEVEEVFPGLVEDALHTLDETEIKYKVLKGSVLPYMLLKAIQEANAKIDALEARLTAMEGK